MLRSSEPDRRWYGWAVRRIGPLVALAVALLAVDPSLAVAKRHRVHIPPAETKVLSDCSNNNQLTRHYPLAVLQQAFNDLPSYLAEYSPCAQEIHDAELADIAGSKAAPNANSSQKANAAKRVPRQLQQAAIDGGEPIDLAGEKIAAGAIGANGSSLLGTLPTPLLIVLIVLMVLATVPLADRIRRLVRARRSR